MKKILLLLLFVSLAFAGDFDIKDTDYYKYYNDTGTYTLKNILTDTVEGTSFTWQEIAAILLSIQFFAIVLLTMISKIFSIRQLDFLLKHELYNYLISSLLIFSIFEIIDLSFDLTKDFLLGGADDVYARCINGTAYINTQAGTFDPPRLFECNVLNYANELSSQYAKIYKSNKVDMKFASFMLSYFGYPIFIGDRDIPGLHNKVNKKNFLAYKYIQFIISLYGQFALMKYIKYNMLAFFLPVGVILRILPYTRDFGNFFIALSFGLFFIFPISYVILDPSFTRVNHIDNGFPIPLIQFTCFKGFSGATSILNAYLQQDIAQAPLFDSYLSDMAGEYSRLLFRVQFSNFASLLITFAFIYLMMSILGGDISEFSIFVQKFV